MRILITGVTGFLGRHLAAALVAAGHRVSGCAVGCAVAVPGVEAAEVDLLDAAGLDSFVRRTAPEAVVHLGGLSHVGASFDRPSDYFRVNVLGSRNLLRALGAAGGGARLVFASSAEVYGSVPEVEQPIAEDRPPAPRSPYAWSKAAAEQLVLEAGGIVTRAFNIIGPGQAPSFALPSFARQLARCPAGDSAPHLAVGDLSPRRDFVHVADAIAAYQTILESAPPGEIFNLACGRAYSVGELLDRLCRIAGSEALIERNEALVRPVDVPLLVGDAGRLGTLGWRPRHSIDEALEALWHEAREAQRSRA